MTAVAPIRLALHLTVASLLLAALVWIATGLDPSPDGRSLETPNGVLPRAAYLLVALVLAQIALGGLVAGSRAGLTYNTWPLMDGHLIPPAAVLLSGTPLIENFVDNLALVQFNHRMVALILVGVALWQALAAWRAGPGLAAARRSAALAGLCLGQMTLGIMTLVFVVPLWAGLAHQLLAMIVLAAAVFHARRCAA
jgi:cytochrome c oxidase assembly protein subunit 15